MPELHVGMGNAGCSIRPEKMRTIISSFVTTGMNGRMVFYSSASSQRRLTADFMDQHHLLHAPRTYHVSIRLKDRFTTFVGNSGTGCRILERGAVDPLWP
jgi:hypothetical protein